MLEWKGIDGFRNCVTISSSIVAAAIASRGRRGVAYLFKSAYGPSMRAGIEIRTKVATTILD
jgi:hypothetical protein